MNNSQSWTTFQKQFTQSDAITIASILHPEQAANLDKLAFYRKYTWICITLFIGGYGQIHIGIDNHAQSKLYGPKVSKADIRKALRDHTIDWKIWRFVDDCKQHLDPVVRHSKQLAVTDHRTCVRVLKEHYSLPTVDEFFKRYYS